MFKASTVTVGWLRSEIATVVIKAGIEPHQSALATTLPLSWIYPIIGTRVIPVINDTIVAEVPVRIPFRDEVNEVAIGPPKQLPSYRP